MYLYVCNHFGAFKFGLMLIFYIIIQIAYRLTVMIDK